MKFSKGLVRAARSAAGNNACTLVAATARIVVCRFGPEGRLQAIGIPGGVLGIL